MAIYGGLLIEERIYMRQSVIVEMLFILIQKIIL